jgi:hypothetical protein
VWSTLLHRLETDLIGNVLPDIVDELMSYDQKNPTVVELWNFLFISKKSELGKFYNSIDFFPLEKIPVIKDSVQEILKV